VAEPRLVVIGAGPIGIEAALRGQQRGWEVLLLEAGRLGEHLCRWGHVRLFTPTRMNISAVAAHKLSSTTLNLDSLLTGQEHVEQVLRPLATSLELREGHRVRSISRYRLTRSELPGHPLRAKRPFELLVEGPQGEERRLADGIIEATGVYGQPRWAGRGGNPVPGERSSDIVRHLPDFSVEPEGWRRDLLLIGNGASAATALRALAELRAEGGGIVHWLVPDDRQRPVDEIPEDPLPERATILRGANDLAARPPPWLRLLRRAALVSARGRDCVVATRAGMETFQVDRILSLVGYRPESALLQELALSLDPAWEGGAGLARALAGVTDCLAKVELNRSDLESGEPDLFLAGHRAYGRRNTFLLQTGIEQVDQIFSGWKLQRKG
jgi:hypothetical protein